MSFAPILFLDRLAAVLKAESGKTTFQQCLHAADGVAIVSTSDAFLIFFDTDRWRPAIAAAETAARVSKEKVGVICSGDCVHKAATTIQGARQQAKYYLTSGRLIAWELNPKIDNLARFNRPAVKCHRNETVLPGFTVVTLL